jgi:uncharacterized protein YbjQ (UPF0145 family)
VFPPRQDSEPGLLFWQRSTSDGERHAFGHYAHHRSWRVARYLGIVSGEAILGANAVRSVDLDYETIQVGSGGGMLMVSASGTAVVLG